MNSPQTTIQVRIDAKTKRESKIILDKIGLDMSSAIKLFLRGTVRNNGIPKELLTLNGYSPEFEKTLIEETEEALKNGKRYSDVNEMFKDLGLRK